MASLNTLRTKFGVVLSIVIGLALLAFILSLKAEMGFTGNDPKVGEIDGEKVTYTEYLATYEKTKSLMGGEATTDAQLDQLSNAAWQQLFAERVTIPGLQKMGLTVTDAEREAVISGEIPTQALYSAFADPATGTFSLEAVANFLSQAETNPQLSAIWSQLVEQAMQERITTKYLALVKNGASVNNAEVERGVAAANKVFSGKFVQKNFATLPDSLFTVTSAEIKKYYEDHKANYKQLPNRTISYVVFDVEATSDDMLAIEQEAKKAAEEFAAAEDLKAYARENRHSLVAQRYLALSQFPEEERAALAAGNQYGPVLKNNIWTMSRVLDSKMAPDSIGVRHLAVPYTEQLLADSLATQLRQGAAFAELAEGMGEERVYPFSAFTEEFIPALSTAKVGDVVEITAGNAIHVMQIYRMDKPSKHLRTVTLNYAVEPSTATRRDVHGKAGIFAVDGAGSMEKFNEAATAAAITPRTTTISQGETLVRGLEDSREIVRWANGAKEGEISEIFNVGSDYVVAMLTAIDDSDYASIEKRQPQIRAAVLRDKKAEAILKEYNATNLEEAATAFESEVRDFSDVRYGSYYVQNIGFEPRVIGAIAAAEQGVYTGPVKGNAAIYVFVVENIADEAKQVADAEKVRLQAAAETMAMQGSFAAIQQMAEVEDLRGKYF